MAYSFYSPRIPTVELALALDRLGPENGLSVLGVVCGDGQKGTPKKCGGTRPPHIRKGRECVGRPAQDECDERGLRQRRGCERNRLIR